ncbi:MAG: succinate dehydrogenase/fumarate reductase iron-sulfur subunit [Bacteriovoracaceae bacterium]|nr:succinate dehydrogenase/fumarate reductase iron-sulfur subunit [Bacteriovoracaceae bacterium]
MNNSNKNNMTIHLKVWRQASNKEKGKMESYTLSDVSPDMSFLEMLDQLNLKLMKEKIEPVSFDHDCREGICGMCSLMINGHAHGPQLLTTTCQLHMREYKDGDEIVIEPWRSRAFPVVKDLVVDRSAFDKIMAAGGFVSVNTGSAPDANGTAIAKVVADEAMDAAQCIGCGACVAACENGSAMLFVAAKVSQLSLLPQGQPEAASRVKSMVAKMDEMGFGNCTNHSECMAACPKGISVEHIARMNRDFLKSSLLQ